MSNAEVDLVITCTMLLGVFAGLGRMVCCQATIFHKVSGASLVVCCSTCMVAYHYMVTQDCLLAMPTVGLLNVSFPSKEHFTVGFFS